MKMMYEVTFGMPNLETWLDNNRIDMAIFRNAMR